MARTPQDPQKRVNEILDTAEPLFLAVGYHGTQIIDIARKMNMAQGMLYYYFKSKDEVLEALLKRHITRTISEVEPLIYSDNIAPPRKFEALMQKIFHAVQDEEHGLLFGALYDEQTLHIVDKLSRQAEQIMAPLLHKIIEDGIQKHYFHVIHPRAAVKIVLALLRSLIDAVYEQSPDDLIECQFKLAEEVFEKILGAEPGMIHILTTSDSMQLE
ncbi:MAG: transcriptional regulator, TetR family [Massilibacillus sp.]|jgi:AcrR family transcriptional regulator|nr:transcriptional regulator, TetR family [Massilibacillus sp.]